MKFLPLLCFVILCLILERKRGQAESAKKSRATAYPGINQNLGREMK